MPNARTVRWLLFPVAAVGSCGTASVATGRLQDWLQTRLGPAALEAMLPLDGQASISLALQAFVFVLAGALVAPRARAVVAPVLFLLGAWLAWFVVGSWYFPQDHPRAYENSTLPLWGCLTGGLLALAMLALPSLRASQHLSQRQREDKGPW